MRLFTGILFVLSLSVLAQVPELELAKARYAEGLENIQTDYKDALVSANLKYRDALGELRKGFVARGDLRGVQAVDAELNGLEAGGLPETATVLERPRQIFERLTAQATAEREQKLQRYREAYVRHLTAMVSAMTRAERIDDALTVQTETEAVNKILESTRVSAKETSEERSIKEIKSDIKEESAPIDRTKAMNMPGEFKVKMYMSYDGTGDLEVFVNSEPVFSSQPKRGLQTPDLKLRSGDLIVVKVSANAEEFTGRFWVGFVAWLVLGEEDNMSVIVPEWRSSRARQIKDVRTDQGKKPRAGFPRVAFQGYFRHVKAVQQIKAQAVWPQRIEGFLVYKLNIKDAVPVKEDTPVIR